MREDFMIPANQMPNVVPLKTVTTPEQAKNELLKPFQSAINALPQHRQAIVAEFNSANDS